MREPAGKLPEWFKIDALNIKAVNKMRRLMEELNLNTVCESARCPNRYECYAHKTATFMILGDTCTRNCRFCCVKKGRPTDLDNAEPKHIVQAIRLLSLKYAVITSVTRDDLPDGGASHFLEVVNAIRTYDPEVIIELLIPDFKGSVSAIEMVAASKINVLNHNLETIPRLYERVRPEADYQRSVALLRRVKEIRPDLLTKSGLMLGLGETKEEILTVMKTLREVGCNILTLGQYLQPSNNQCEVARFVRINEFAYYEKAGERMGFKCVISGPKVRSSYHASSTYYNYSSY
ncbi:MAG: lipoyl synthase [Desulfomonilia bacterium]|jgi:lipoic acid synthetase|nr:lipoyl synthase [Desulfomonilia bacterium]